MTAWGMIVILRGEQRPELLAARPHRWLTPPTTTTRTNPAPSSPACPSTAAPSDLAEIDALLEDAGREVASPELLHRLDLAAQDVEDGPVHPQ